MSSAQQKATEKHRNRLKSQGIVRVEIQAAEADVPLIRQLAKTLRSDPEKAAAARRQLRALVGSGQTGGLKALLASVPLEGIEIIRPEDPGREVDL